MTPRFPSRQRPKPRLEKDEQLAIRQLMLSLGAKEYVLGTKRRRGDYAGTMQTPGLPDLQFFLPDRRRDAHLHPWRFLVVEVKREKLGRFRPEQIEYRDLCRAAGVDYIGGSLDDVIVWLVREGYVKNQNLPHYRQVAEPAK